MISIPISIIDFHCLVQPKFSQCSYLTSNRGGVLCIGGPALVWYVTPTPEELFKVREGPIYTKFILLMNGNAEI